MQSREEYEASRRQRMERIRLFEDHVRYWREQERKYGFGSGVGYWIEYYNFQAADERRMMRVEQETWEFLERESSRRR